MVVLHLHQRNLECVLKFHIPKSYARSSDPKSPLNLTIGLLHKHPSDSNENQYLGIIYLESIKSGIYTVRMKWHDVQHFVRLSEHGFNTEMGKSGREKDLSPSFSVPLGCITESGAWCAQHTFLGNKWMKRNKQKQVFLRTVLS